MNASNYVNNGKVYMHICWPQLIPPVMCVAQQINSSGIMPCQYTVITQAHYQYITVMRLLALHTKGNLYLVNNKTSDT